MKLEENIQDIQTRFIHIVNHLSTLDNYFQNKDLVHTVPICLNHNWKPIITMIYESKDFSTTDLATVFDKLQEHEIKLNCLSRRE